MCGTRATRVLDGAVDYRDLFLSEVETARGETITVCYSRAARSASPVPDM